MGCVCRKRRKRKKRILGLHSPETGYVPWPEVKTPPRPPRLSRPPPMTYCGRFCLPNTHIYSYEAANAGCYTGCQLAMCSPESHYSRVDGDGDELTDI